MPACRKSLALTGIIVSENLVLSALVCTNMGDTGRRSYGQQKVVVA